jgi:putative DNA primase/helicase
MAEPRRTKADVESSAEKPEALPVNADGIPAELKELPQWVCWRYEWRVDKAGRGKWTKILKNPATGRNAKSNSRATWGTYAQALAAYQAGGFDGIGFVFSPDDPFAGVDLDDAIDPETGDLRPLAAEVVATLATYTEVSPSGTGLKAYLRGRVPEGITRREGEIACYDRGRYFCLTGARWPGTPTGLEDRQEALEAVCRKFQTKRKPAAKPGTNGQTTADANGHARGAKTIFGRLKMKWSPPDGPLSDDDIIKLAESGLDEKLTALWNGATSGHGDDHSAADAALCSKLLWWIGGPDAARLDRLFRQSKLMRPKWDERRGEKTYGRLTIDYAIGVQTDYRQTKAEQIEEDDGRQGAPTMAHGMILAYLRDRYRPMFRCGAAIHSEALHREVKPAEARETPDTAIIARLATAANAPKTKNGKLNVNALPGFFSTWCKVAWGQLLKELPDEDEMEEVSEAAQADFRHKVATALAHHEVTIGETSYHGKEEVTRTEKKPVLYFALKEARGRRWARLRHFSIWARIGEGPPFRVEVAIRAELFAEIRYRPLEDLRQNTFRRRCEHYAIGEGGSRATGRKAVVLTNEFLESLMVDLNAEEANTCPGDQNGNSDDSS